MTMYRIEFDNGVTVITPDWETVVQYVNGGDVETVTINGCGEILHDAQSVALRAPFGETYGIELTNGKTVYVKSWRMVVAFVNTLRHHVTRIVISYA